jgi:hypothetical protein
MASNTNIGLNIIGPRLRLYGSALATYAKYIGGLMRPKAQQTAITHAHIIYGTGKGSMHGGTHGYIYGYNSYMIA